MNPSPSSVFSTHLLSEYFWTSQPTIGDVIEETDNWHWGHVSIHDLHRSWATSHLVERQVDVRTMLVIGWWSDYSAIEPYVDDPTGGRIGVGDARVTPLWLLVDCWSAVTRQDTTG